LELRDDLHRLKERFNFPLTMDGPNGRPEPGYGTELNHRPQQGDTPTSQAPSVPGPGEAAVPEAISFRQLEALRQSAIEAQRTSSLTERASGSPIASPMPGPSQGHPQAGLPQPGQAQPGGDELAELEQLLGAYGQLGQRLLQQLARQGTALEQHRHPQQVMALGALAAHIRLGLQALAASRQ
jgi:hypothetical protein